MKQFYGAVSSFGECGLPCGLRGALCTLQLFRSALHRASSTVATLGMSGWLDLPQPGLPPGKKRQASLGALTQKRTSLDQRRIDWKWKLLYLLAQAGVHASGESEKGRLLAPLAEGDGR